MHGVPDIRLTLPLPPSANRIWRTGRGATYKSADYTAWLKQCAWEAALQTRGGRNLPLAGRYAIRITLPAARIDPDNRVKPINDMLQKAAVVANDKALVELHLVVADERVEATMLLELWDRGPLPVKAKPPRKKRPSVKVVALRGQARLW